jgi:hypothetical protein
MRWLAYLRPSCSSLRECTTPCAWLGCRRTKAAAARRAPVTSPKPSNHFSTLPSTPDSPGMRAVQAAPPLSPERAARPRLWLPCPKTACKPSQGEPLYLLHIPPARNPAGAAGFWREPQPVPPGTQLRLPSSFQGVLHEIGA